MTLATQQEPCPSAEELDAFTAAGLDASRRAALETHLCACASCSSIVAALMASEWPSPIHAPRADELEAVGPRYRLLQLLGAGGMGAVYEAEEILSGRRVALKLAHEPGSARDEHVIRRFERERRVASLLEHPNIVPVFDLGVFPDGVAYYTQRLVHGRTLSTAIATCAGPRARVLLMRHFAELCDAVGYAHSHGVVHRDLKPGNTLIGLAGETWVIDWGLAKVTNSRLLEAVEGGAGLPSLARGAPGAEPVSDPSLTAVGAMMGTPAYMSPEQARGEIDLVDERSDVWGLGAVLFELLTGRRPFAELDVPEVLRELRAGRGPSLPPELATQVPPELVAIATKALSPERAGRYASARELAADVNAWMLGGTVSAYNYSLAERARRFVKRYRVLVAVVTVAALAGSGWAYALRTANLRLRHQRAGDLIHRAQLFAAMEQWDRAAVYYAGALDNEESAEARMNLAALGVAAPRPLWKQPAPTGTVRGVAFADEHTVVAAGENGTAVAFDLESGAEVARLALSDPILTAVPCGTGAVVLAGGRSVALWNPRQQRSGARIVQPDPVERTSASEGCELLATASKSGVRVFRASTGEQVARFGTGQPAIDVAFLRGRRLVWATGSGLREAPDALEATEGPSPALVTRPIKALSSSPASGRLVVSLAGGVMALDLSRPGVATLLPDPQDHAHTVGYQAGFIFPSGRDAVMFSGDNSTRFFDLDLGISYDMLAGLAQQTLAAAASPDGRWFATGGMDRNLRVYDLIDARRSLGNRRPGVAATGDTAVDITWSADGAQLASCEGDGTVQLWSAASGLPSATLTGPKGPVRAVRFSPDGRTLAAAGGDGLLLWNISTGRPLGAAQGGPAEDVAWLPDGRSVAVAQDDGAVVLRSLDGGERTLHHEHHGPVLRLARSPDGRLLASAGNDGLLVVYDLARGAVAGKVVAHEDPIDALAFSRDGRQLATASAGHELRFWGARSLSPLDEEDNNGAYEIRTLDFAPERSSVRKGLLAATPRGILFFGPKETRAPHAYYYRLSSGPLVAARFSPDGRTLALLTSGGNLRLAPIDPPPGDPLARLMKIFRYESENGDLVRDEDAMVPPELRAKEQPSR